jgi:hypothetical protein
MGPSTMQNTPTPEIHATPEALATRIAAIEKRLTRRWPANVSYTRPGVTRLCADGPPRSANSLLCHKIQLANRELSAPVGALSHHTHDVDSVLLAALAGIPVIMPLRDPMESLASLAVYRDGKNMAAGCAQYARMCQLALTHPEEVLVAHFDTIVNDVNAVFRAANERFGIALAPLPMSDAEANELIADRVRKANLHGDKSTARMGIPDESRNAAKAEAATQLDAVREFRRCKLLYAKLVNRGADV